MSKLKGVTLIEVLIVVLILGALTAIAIPRFAASAATAKQRACDANVERINSQIELYEHNTGTWPQALTDITDNVSYFGGDKVACPFGNPYILNNSIHRVIRHKHGGDGSRVVDGGGGNDDGGQGNQGGQGGQGGQGNQGSQGGQGNHGDNGNHGEGDDGNHYGWDNGNHYGWGDDGNPGQGNSGR